MSLDRLDHALVGGGHVLALVAPDTCVDWLCLPRFDSPPVLAGILDRARAGVFQVSLAGGEGVLHRQHRDANAVRTTLRSTESGVHIDDFCPPGAAAFTRLITPTHGAPEINITLDLRPDFGRAAADVEILGPHTARVGETWVTTDGRIDAVLGGEPVRLDRPLSITLCHGAPMALASPSDALTEALEADQALVAAIPEPLRRSALCLLAHIYRPTGAIIAAATTSIPEAIGEPRNWDYRYAWVRDGCFAAEALIALGLTEPAAAFLDFLERVIGDSVPRPLYGVDGETDLEESIVAGLRGFAGTTPIRVGNEAVGQVQHDTWGQIVWLAERLATASGEAPAPERFQWLAGLVEGASRVWDQPDAGIWEFRDRPGRYTSSAAWCWAAHERGARLAERAGDDARASRWASQGQTIRQELMDAADREGFFAQTAEDAIEDASSLPLAAMGLVSGTDPRFLATLERCESALEIGGLMRRYVAIDDFGETHSTFSLCTLWWVEALVLAGRRDDATRLFDHFLGHANPHGLFSEDIAPNGQLLGNFPQVYTHVGLIRAWLALHDSA